MKIICTNRKSNFNYFVVSEFISGICLNGSEIKSVRKGEVEISESYCMFGGKNKSELFIKNMFIKLYGNRDGFLSTLDPNRDRKLLLNKHELLKLSQKVQQKGMTIVPLKVVINDKGLCKIVIGLCKGKNVVDKRQTIKERDLDREIKGNI